MGDRIFNCYGAATSAKVYTISIAILFFMVLYDMHCIALICMNVLAMSLNNLYYAMDLIYSDSYQKYKVM